MACWPSKSKTGWLRCGSSRYARQADLGKRVDTALTRLKSRWGVVVKKDDGKWYPVTEGSEARSDAA